MTWDEASQTLTIGDRRGSFPSMLASRTFRVVWVGPNHGTGLQPVDKPDAVLSYNGKSLSLKAPAAP